ncbi:MAG TPA: hypothetical protein VMF66_18330 [Candidatus Acidoferrum sp.]|nr:hypothetical protein [Candidatus Acidoferrum sp.]
MGILDATEQSPPAKAPRYIIATGAAIVAVFLVLWYPVGLRFHTQHRIIRNFMNELASGDMHAAYKHGSLPRVIPFPIFFWTGVLTRIGAPFRAIKLIPSRV